MKRIIEMLSGLAGMVGVPIFFLAFIISGIFGPGAVIALAEKPFGVGPWGHIGSYCMKISATNHDIATSLGTSPPSDIRQKIRSDLEYLIKNSPDRTIKVQYARWVMGQSIQSEVMVSESSAAINQWTQRSCNSADIKIPSWFNGLYNGILGPGFGSFYRLPGA